MQPLPEWTQRGAIIGLEGGSAEVGNVTEVLLQHKAPLVGVWLQDWVGTRHDWDGTRLIWNWQVRCHPRSYVS
jgi:alpha-glucosidase